MDQMFLTVRGAVQDSVRATLGVASVFTTRMGSLGNLILEQPKRQIFAPNVMAIRDQRHDKKSKQTTPQACFDVAPPIGVGSRSRVFHWEMMNIKKDTFI